MSAPKRASRREPPREQRLKRRGIIALDVITARDFRLLEYQTVVFTPGLQFIQNKLLSALLGKWGELFDGDPIKLPQSQDFPPEVPRLILRSQDSHHELRASGGRLDFFWRPEPEEVADVAAHLTSSIRLCIDYLDLTRGVASRLAAVVKRVALREEPGKTLAAYFCQDRWLHGPLDTVQEFQLHAHEVSQLQGGLNVNSWFRAKSSLLAKDGKPVILVEQDLNTVAEEAESREFTAEELEGFFFAANPQLDRILEAYFPEAHGG